MSLPSYGSSIAGRTAAVQALYDVGIVTSVWEARELLGARSVPGNPDPHAPANRKERPWNPPRSRA